MMNEKQLFEELLAIKDSKVRLQRIQEIREQDERLAVRIVQLLKNAEMHSIFEDPTLLLISKSVDPSSRYRVNQEIARGAMGVIYSAFDSQLRREVVIKCLNPEHRNNIRARQRLHDEAYITAKLQHPGIAPVYEVGTMSDGSPFFCMKWVLGQTLAKILAERKSPSAKSATVEESRLTNIFLQVCQTMAFAHQQNIVHRDLKPVNIIVGSHGEAYVMDWGVGKSLDQKENDKELAEGKSNIEGEVSSTLHGQVVGTPGYMSPEQAMGLNGSIGTHADVYSLGAMLFEFLTGKSLGKTNPATIENFDLLHRDVARQLSHAKADKQLADIALKCLQSQPEQRPRDAAEVTQFVLAHTQRLESLARNREIELEKEKTRQEESQKRRFWNSLSLAVCAAILVAGIIGTSTGFYRESIARKRAVNESQQAVLAQEAAENSKQEALDAKEMAESRLSQLVKGNEIISTLFNNLHPDEIAKSGKTIDAILAENLDRVVEQIDGDSVGAPDLVASYEEGIADCYLAVGQYKKAVRLYQKTLQHAVSRYGESGERTKLIKSKLEEALASE